MEEIPSLAGRRVLVVEDDYLVAQIIEELLEEYGAQVVGPIGWVEEAVRFVQSLENSFDCAVLDLNLHGQKSYPVADALLERGIKFAFATGYGSGVLETCYRQYPRCEKPFNLKSFYTMISKL